MSIDSTGVGTKLFDRWLSHPTDRSKDFVKLHVAVDDRGAAHAVAITDGATNDAIVLPYHTMQQATDGVLQDLGLPLAI